VLSHSFVPDPEIFAQLEGLKLEADDELIYVFNIDADPDIDDSKHSMVSVLITDAFIGEEVKPEKKHHQAYTPMGEKKPGMVYKRSTEKRRIGSNLSQHNYRKSSASSAHHRRPPRKYAGTADAPPPTLFPASDIHKNGMKSYSSIPTVSCGQKSVRATLLT
jgi:hypothetical protein